ncbi:hypothetical protein [Loktanella sp. S4079]|uniref:hypothetical protein n=1 Tax=Loktanella sp. S4079 TaxID=579483 RepID=UPI0012EDCCFD|nr:hypothetical protein [Loktanella sp. S4079]
MLTIFADSFVTATRQTRWSPPYHSERRLRSYEIEQLRAEERERARNGGKR